MSKFLSILVPSKRPEELKLFLKSLYETCSKPDDIEIVILTDSSSNYTKHYNDGFDIIHIHKVPDNPLNMSDLNHHCYRNSTGKWIMLGNDDMHMETLGWDNIIKDATKVFEDEVALIYPNDNMFGEQLACFPIISRKVIEATTLWPMKYLRYKQDDTIFGMFPANRRIYLENVHLTHLNDKGQEGYVLRSGRIYPFDKEVAVKDNMMWQREQPRRSQLSQIIRKMIGIVVPTSKVLIGISTCETARQAIFYDYMDIMEKPDGSVKTMIHGQSPARSRNLIIEQALEHECSHVLFIDDDVIVPPDIINRLLSHDKDIVTGLALMRQYPHNPLVFDYAHTDGRNMHYFLEDGVTGLKEITNCGFGAVLVKTEVFKAMEKPWVRLGEYDVDMWCDDIGFFNRARNAGFKLYVDLDCILGHMTTVAVRPHYMNNKWYVSYNTSGTGEILAEIPRPSKEQLEKEKYERTI